MSRQRIIDSVPSVLVAFAAAGYVSLSYGYDLASRSLPWIAGVLAVVFALLDLVGQRFGAGPMARSSQAAQTDRLGAADPAPPAAAHSVSQEIIAFAWIGAFLPLVMALGFYAAILLYVFCYLRLYGGKGAAASAAVAFGVVGFLFLVFDVLMGYEIFAGLLGGDVL